MLENRETLLMSSFKVLAISSAALIGSIRENSSMMLNNFDSIPSFGLSLWHSTIS